MRNLYAFILKDQLYQNSLFIMLGTFTMAVFGFIFWIIVARFFSPQSVGIATTLISSMTLIVSFSDLGVTTSLIRYLPKSENKNILINSSFFISSLAAFLASIIFLTFITQQIPQLTFLKSNYLYILSFVSFSIFLNWNNILESIFKAYRASINILTKNIILSSIKVVLPFGLLVFGAYGIISSVFIATGIASLISTIILIYRYNYKPKISLDVGVVKSLATFSLGNYIAGFLYQAPILLLPIIIINYLDAEFAAYYYIDSTILNLLIIIPTAISQTLLTEGSYDDSSLNKNIYKASIATILLLLPAVIINVLFGQIILSAFGKNYANDAFPLLQLMSISTFFMTITLMGSTVLRIKHQIKKLIFSNLIGSSIILFLCYILLSKGLTGIGWGWFLGQLIMGFIFLVIIIKEVGIKSPLYFLNAK